MAAPPNVREMSKQVDGTLLRNDEGFIGAVFDAVERVGFALGLEEHEHRGRFQLALHAQHYILVIPPVVAVC